MLAIYWETLGRWILQRAQRDATALQTPLYLIQAADMFQPLMTDQDAAKLMNHPNPHQTGAMHGFLLAHVGMRFRLLDTIDKERGLVKDAEGTLVHVAHARGQERAAGSRGRH